MLTPSGSLTISTAGTIIDARDINGNIVVNAPNVTIRNSRITSSAMFVIQSNSTGLVVENVEITDAPGGNKCHDAISTSNYTIVRSEISGCENAGDMQGDNVTFTDNYVHDLDQTGPSYVWGNSPHTDGIQMGPRGRQHRRQAQQDRPGARVRAGRHVGDHHGTSTAPSQTCGSKTTIWTAATPPPRFICRASKARTST